MDSSILPIDKYVFFAGTEYCMKNEWAVINFISAVTHDTHNTTHPPSQIKPLDMPDSHVEALMESLDEDGGGGISAEEIEEFLLI